MFEIIIAISGILIMINHFFFEFMKGDKKDER